jgi:hypothetical protein
MPRFDVYRNPNPHATHSLYLDIQSDLVTTATRWCIPLRREQPGVQTVQRAHCMVGVEGTRYVVDTPNVLAVPAALLRRPVQHLAASDQTLTEAAIEFMLRGH